ncbi:MAG: methyltransferase [Beijerinckiaceae bacterium]|nr:methyltransferase [Beijerinckiaceae bacterium]MCZ8298860.1 methyltransferase [Beijerinckiaceae bacterium]
MQLEARPPAGKGDAALGANRQGEGETTDDRLFRGTLLLRQPARGHRAGTDAVLLAAAAPAAARHILDLGASTGMVGLQVAMGRPEARAILLERDPAMAALARHNIAANGLADRVSCREADAFALGREKDLREAFDLVLTNPPYFTPGRVRASPDAKRRAAHELDGDLDGWLRNAATMLAPGGEIVIIHRADAVGDVLAAMARRFGGLALRFIHPRPSEPAHRLLVSGKKGSRQGLTILPPLVLFEGDGPTALSAALHDGLALLPMRPGQSPG